jgi:hypothetical protein
MATLEEMAGVLRRKNPTNDPMLLCWIAEQLWPDADWLDRRCTRHNGGARRGARVAAGMAGRMASRGLLKRYFDPHYSTTSMWKWVRPNAIVSGLSSVK